MMLVALGANIFSHAGAPQVTLHRALDTLSVQFGAANAVSRFWRTPAWPNPQDPPFANAVARFETALAPKPVLDILHAVETQYGRQRSETVQRNSPRPLDLDLIDYDGLVQAGPPDLPHPRMHERAFVLVPLREIAPEWRHPVTGRSVDELIAALPKDSLAMEPL